MLGRSLLARRCVLAKSALRGLSSLARQPRALLAPTRPFARSPKSVWKTSQLQQLRTYAETVVKVPQMAESISEGTLKQFSKQVGDYVEQDEEIATIETDKIDVAVNAPEAGTIKEFLVSEEDTVTVGQELCKLETGGGGGEKKEQHAESQAKGPASDKQETSSQPSGQKEQEASESEKKEQKKEEPNQGKKEAQSQKKETENTSKAAPPPEAAPKTGGKSPASAPPKQDKPKEQPKSLKQDQQQPAPQPGSREERRVKMNRMRLRISERLKQSQNTAASLTTFQKVDMQSLMEFRKLYKDDILKKTGVKLGFMSAFSRACILAMKDIPAVNASIEGPNGGDTIVYRDYVDISVAVATEKGLVTPIVRNAESLDMIGIERAIAELGKKARDNKLTIEDMAGGTFTISNGGVFGSLFGTPIINLPQTAVLGLHAINQEPVVLEGGKIEARPIMYLALTYDHRLLDGREAVTFLVKVKQYIEDPRRMLLG